MREFKRSEARRADARRRRLLKIAKDPRYYAKVQKDWRDRNPDKSREANRRQKLREKYGITEYIYEQMRAAQNDTCPICRKPLPPGRQAHIDHHHGTGKVRALLCRRCNTGLGYVENWRWISSAIAYLISHRLGEKK